MAKVSLQSVQFGCYLRLDASQFEKDNNGGSGTVNCQFNIGSYEEFDMQDAGDGHVQFESCAFPGYFLRMDGSNIGSKSNDGSGKVNVENYSGPWEKFKVQTDGGGLSTIESVTFPGIYLRADAPGITSFQPAGAGTVDCQFGAYAWEKWRIVSPAKMTLAELKDVIAKHGPTLALYSRDPYRMCSIEWFLSQTTLVNTKNGNRIPSPKVSDLPTGSESKDFHLLQADSSIGGKQETAKAYVRAYSAPGSSYTDIQFWFFYAFNGPAIAFVGVSSAGATIDVAPQGTHPGDIEMAAIRVDNTTKSLISVGTSAHGTYNFDSDLGSFDKDDGRVIVYSGFNTHAVFKTVGYNPYGGLDEAGFHVSIVNLADKGGPDLKCNEQYELVSVSWLSDFQEPRWLDFEGRWGWMEREPPLIDPSPSVQDQLENALGALTFFMPLTAAVYIVSELIKKVVTNYVLDADLTGPEGPKQKDTWNGNYS